MKTIIYERGSKSINADKILTTKLYIRDGKGVDVIFNNTDIKKITEIPEDILKICKFATISCIIEGINEPIHLIRSENIKWVVGEFVSIQYFLNQPEYTEPDFDIDFENGKIDDMVYFNQYFIREA